MTVLWTVLPVELVLDGIDKPPAYEEVELSGAKVLVERLTPGESRVVRLLSTSPADYLRPELQPGTTLIHKPALAAVE
jgi:hypothetical protein